MKKALYFSITAALIITVILLACIVSNKNNTIKELGKLKTGVCIYVEYDGTYVGRKPTYMLVYDEDTDTAIELDIDKRLINIDVRVGDTIVYIVNVDYSDADFINVIKKENIYG